MYEILSDFCVLTDWRKIGRLDLSRLSLNIFIERGLSQSHMLKTVTAKLFKKLTINLNVSDFIDSFGKCIGVQLPLNGSSGLIVIEHELKLNNTESRQ